MLLTWPPATIWSSLPGQLGLLWLRRATHKQVPRSFVSTYLWWKWQHQMEQRGGIWRFWLHGNCCGCCKLQHVLAEHQPEPCMAWHLQRAATTCVKMTLMSNPNLVNSRAGPRFTYPLMCTPYALMPKCVAAARSTCVDSAQSPVKTQCTAHQVLAVERQTMHTNPCPSENNPCNTCALHD